MLSALKDRVITVRLEDASTDSVRKSRWLATTTIGGKTDVQLQAVYVQLKPKTMVPSVAYVELYGVGAYEMIEKAKGTGKVAETKSAQLLVAMQEQVQALQAQPQAPLSSTMPQSGNLGNGRNPDSGTHSAAEAAVSATIEQLQQSLRKADTNRSGIMSAFDLGKVVGLSSCVKKIIHTCQCCRFCGI